jgi:tetratricopeptide (TPR) repeat protein
MLSNWDWAGARREFTESIRLDPSYPTARHWYAEWLQMHGRFDEAIAEISRAVELDPLSPAILKDKGVVLYYARDFEGAISFARKSQELHPEFPAVHRLLSLAYSGLGDHDRALEENSVWGAMGARKIEVITGGAYCHAAAGKRDDALTLIAPLISTPPDNGNVMRGVALVYAALGDADLSFAWFERAYVLRAESLGTLPIDPKIDVLRKDTRLEDLIRRVGLKPLAFGMNAPRPAVRDT